MARNFAALRVRKVHPGATAKQWSHAWCIERTWPPTGNEKPIGEGKTENEAWKDAAKKIGKEAL